MAARAHTYRFVVEDEKGKDVLVYEGQVTNPTRTVRVQTDGETVSLVAVDEDQADLEPSQVAPLVLATGRDPGRDLFLVRTNLSRSRDDAKPVRTPVR